MHHQNKTKKTNYFGACQSWCRAWQPPCCSPVYPCQACLPHCRTAALASPLAPTAAYGRTEGAGKGTNILQYHHKIITRGLNFVRRIRQGIQKYESLSVLGGHTYMQYNRFRREEVLYNIQNVLKKCQKIY